MLTLFAPNKVQEQVIRVEDENDRVNPHSAVICCPLHIGYCGKSFGTGKFGYSIAFSIPSSVCKRQSLENRIFLPQHHLWLSNKSVNIDLISTELGNKVGLRLSELAPRSQREPRGKIHATQGPSCSPFMDQISVKLLMFVLLLASLYQSTKWGNPLFERSVNKGKKKFSPLFTVSPSSSAPSISPNGHFLNEEPNLRVGVLVGSTNCFLKYFVRWKFIHTLFVALVHIFEPIFKG